MVSLTLAHLGMPVCHPDLTDRKIQRLLPLSQQILPDKDQVPVGQDQLIIVGWDQKGFTVLMLMNNFAASAKSLFMNENFAKKLHCYEVTFVKK